MDRNLYSLFLGRWGLMPPFLIFNQVNLLRCKFPLPEEVCVECTLTNYFLKHCVEVMARIILPLCHPSPDTLTLSRLGHANLTHYLVAWV